jgi:hypothetical protein
VEEVMPIAHSREVVARSGLPDEARVVVGHERRLADPEPLAAMLQEMLRPGDVLAVWRLDRLGRSLKQLIQVMGGLEDQGIGFHSVTVSIDTTTPGGKLVFHIFGAVAAGVPSTTLAIFEMPCVSTLARSRW